MLKEKILRRCCICRAIEINNEIVPFSEYDPEFFKKLGYDFTDGYLSRECVKNFYSAIELKKFGGEEYLRDLKYESCN